MFHIELHLFQLIQIVNGPFQFSGNGQARVGLKVKYQGVAPPNGFTGLHFKSVLNVAEPWLVDAAFETVPGLLKVTRLFNTMVVAVNKSIPQGTPILKTIIPGQM